MPFGKQFVAWLKEKLKTTNKEFRIGLPKDAIAAYAHEAKQDSVRFVFAGHFHNPFHIQDQGKAELWVLPAWLDGGALSHFDPQRGQLESGPWRKLLSQIDAKLA
jgi:UDP-2,3-diacylglucosamine pyrophosphatase LpxH